MTYKTSKRTWTFRNPDGGLETYSVDYTLFFKDTKIVDIRNEFHYSVESNSDCWEYFQRKYKNGLI